MEHIVDDGDLLLVREAGEGDCGGAGRVQRKDARDRAAVAKARQFLGRGDGDALVGVGQATHQKRRRLRVARGGETLDGAQTFDGVGGLQRRGFRRRRVAQPAEREEPEE